MGMELSAFMYGDSALIWNADAIQYLREKWRIIGGMIGALPQRPRQNNQLGLPLKLMAEEVTLLKEKGVLTLLVYEPPTLSAEETKRFSQHREQDFESQHVQYIKAKRKKETTHSACEDEIRQAKKPRLDVTSSIDSFSPLVHIHTQDTTPRTHPLYDSWNYPDTSNEKLKYAVYSDLWHKGYYLTSALKYGGDYLIYNQDPEQVHSDYIAVVLPRQQTISSLVSLGRIGTKVKKKTLLCSIINGEVHYKTLQWMGI